MHTSRRSTPRSARRCSSVAGALLALALVATACGGDASTPEPAPDEGPASSPALAPEPSPSPAPDGGDGEPGEPGGVRIVEGWSPYEVFADRFSPWADGAAMEVAGWLDHVLPARATPAGAATIDVDVAVELDPGPCFAFDRPVTAVRVGVAGPGMAGARDAGAAAAIGTQLLDVARAGGALLDEYREPSAEDLAWCESRFERAPVGFHLVEVHGEACAMPGGPGVVCATVGTFGYHLGAREFWFADTLVFDAATGERLDAEALLAPYDPALLDDLFARIRADVPISIPHLAGHVAAADLDLTPTSDDADLMPTVEGMRWRWSPYLHVMGSIDVVVPWDVLEETVRR